MEMTINNEKPLNFLSDWLKEESEFLKIPLVDLMKKRHNKFQLIKQKYDELPYLLNKDSLKFENRRLEGLRKRTIDNNKAAEKIGVFIEEFAYGFPELYFLQLSTSMTTKEAISIGEEIFNKKNEIS